MSIAIRDGSDPAVLRGFFDLAVRIYAHDDLAPPVDIGKQREHIDQLAASGAQRVFVAHRDGVPVARVLARQSPLHRDVHEHSIGLLGYFEALDDLEAVRPLFERATQYLHDLGCRTIIGPMDGDTWHRYRVNVGPFEEPPFLLEPYNPSYYATLWLSAGFSELERYSSKRVGDITPLLPRLREKYEAAMKNGYSFMSMDLGNFKRELERVHAISTAIFRDNFLYSDLDRETFAAMYGGAEKLLSRDSSWFCVAPDGNDAGFVFAYPDRFEAMRRIQRGGMISKISGLLRWNRVTAVNYKTLGVLPQYRRGGTGAALLYCGYNAALGRGWRTANHCLMRDDNVSQKMDAGEGEVFRRYVLYAKELA